MVRRFLGSTSEPDKHHGLFLREEQPVLRPSMQQRGCKNAAPQSGSTCLSVFHNLQSAFDETSSYSRYHPPKGYSWELKVTDKPAKKENAKEEPSSLFQRQRVDMLLMELTKKFPLPQFQPPPPAKAEIDKTEPVVKSEKVDSPCMKPPPKKKPRLN